MSEFQKRLEANIRESLRFAVGEVQDDAVAHMVAGVNAVLNHPSAPPVPHLVAWQDMTKAPKNGTILRLLVNPDQEEFTAFDDSLTPFETIGFNNLANTEEDRWEFAGWDWSQDCFITGRGEVIGWSPFSSPAPASRESGQ